MFNNFSINISYFLFNLNFIYGIDNFGTKHKIIIK